MSSWLRNAGQEVCKGSRAVSVVECHAECNEVAQVAIQIAVQVAFEIRLHSGEPGKVCPLCGLEECPVGGVDLLISVEIADHDRTEHLCRQRAGPDDKLPR